MADEELTCALVTSADKLMMNLKVEHNMFFNMFFITVFANLCDIGMILACPLSLEPTLAFAHRGMKSHFQVITVTSCYSPLHFPVPVLFVVDKNSLALPLREDG